MSHLLLHNARVILKDRIQSGGVLVKDGIITLLFTPDQKPAGLSASESIDLNEAYLAPGLIDIHIHGSTGVDVQATDADGLARISAFLLGEGVTGYFPTFVPTDETGYRESLAIIASFINHPLDRQYLGARILGVHFEGPFVSEQRCGALRTKYFRTYDGDARSIEVFTGPSDGTGTFGSRLMTLAPEIHGGLDLTRELTRRGVRVFIGHTQAEPDVLDLAVEAGASHITHFPNALEPLHHRKPGAVAWGLVRDDVTLDCIADFQHVHPLMLKLIYESKKPDGVALISDAIMPAGLGDGDYAVWDEPIKVRNGRTTLARHPGDNTIAGSVITMRQALKNMIGLGVPIHEAVRMASSIPSRVAGIDEMQGSIEVGKHGDLTVFNEDFSVRMSTIRGVAMRMGDESVG